ncbi:MAG: hypothetical protein WHV66_11230 [Anaerolineales bacterium]
MSKRVLILFFTLVLVLSLKPSSAQPAHAGASIWKSTIAYFNPMDTVSPQGDEINVVYYRTSGEMIPSAAIKPLQPYQSGVILVGSVLFDEGFKGSAVVSATVPLMTLYHQVSDPDNPYSPILYTGFDSRNVGLAKFFLPAVQLGAFDTRVGIQNVDNNQVRLTLKFYTPDGTEYLYPTNPTLQSQRTFIKNVSELASSIPGFPQPFDGSLVIESKVVTTNVDARLVAAVQDIQAGGRKAYAYEGSPGVYNEWVMISAMCKYGSFEQTTRYYIQNTQGAPANVQVSYYDPSNGSLAVVYPGATEYIQIPAWGRATVDGCQSGIAAGRSLTAVVRSSGPVAVVGKTISKDGLMTAFSGQTPPQAGGDGRYRVGFPYVVYEAREKGERTFLSMVNIGENPANILLINYYGRDGSLIQQENLASNPVPSFAKRSSNPSAAGAIDEWAVGFLGATLVESDQPIVGMARIQRVTDLSGYNVLGEDYSGLVFIK